MDLLTGRRVRLEPLHPKYYEWLYSASTRSTALLGWRLAGRLPTIEQYFQRINQDGDFQAVFVERSSDRPVGFSQLYAPDYVNGFAYVSLLLDDSSTMQGWPLEGIGLFFEYIFRTTPLRKLYFESTVEVFAKYSSALDTLLEQEGLLRRHVFRDGGYVDVVIASLTREAWQDYSPARQLFGEGGRTGSEHSL